MTMENLMSGVGVFSVDTRGLLSSDMRMRINVLCQRSHRKGSVLAGIDIIRDNWID
jgi:hypothetical protein